ncbi:hypothetical protein BKA66DRAFT_462491 [Pyrenochaeta sp. MPI-SDFR-AT-0127]|nr:hypothetical protein BKA66DRAFT_462491 [Pyrenochaeta sp. MPI-SDFR-AT-0127]
MTPKRKMVCIWSTSIQLTWGVAALRAIITKMHLWASRLLKPKIQAWVYQTSTKLPPSAGSVIAPSAQHTPATIFSSPSFNTPTSSLADFDQTDWRNLFGTTQSSFQSNVNLSPRITKPINRSTKGSPPAREKAVPPFLGRLFGTPLGSKGLSPAIPVQESSSKAVKRPSPFVAETDSTSQTETEAARQYNRAREASFAEVLKSFGNSSIQDSVETQSCSSKSRVENDQKENKADIHSEVDTGVDTSVNTEVDTVVDTEGGTEDEPKSEGSRGSYFRPSSATPEPSVDSSQDRSDEVNDYSGDDILDEDFVSDNESDDDDFEPDDETTIYSTSSSDSETDTYYSKPNVSFSDEDIEAWSQASLQALSGTQIARMRTIKQHFRRLNQKEQFELIFRALEKGKIYDDVYDDYVAAPIIPNDLLDYLHKVAWSSADDTDATSYYEQTTIRSIRSALRSINLRDDRLVHLWYCLEKALSCRKGYQCVEILEPELANLTQEQRKWIDYAAFEILNKEDQDSTLLR